MSEYDAHAASYDALYVDYKDDIPFYVEEARRSGSPVLELACGTGRVSIPIAEAGIELVGIDSSPAMLEHFRARLPHLDARVRDRITLHQADMRDFDLGDGRFTLVTCPFRAFLHLLTTDDQLAALGNVHRHLQPGGRFAVNFFNPSVGTIARSQNSHGRAIRPIQEYVHPQTGNTVIVYLSPNHNAVEQIIRDFRIEEEIDAAGRVVERTYKSLTIRWIYRYEFEHLLARCGFEVEALYGDFDRRPFSRDRDELIWIARKR